MLVYPSFRAGLDAFLAFRHDAAALTALVEDAGIGVLVFEPTGLHARQNEIFRQLMSS